MAFAAIAALNSCSQNEEFALDNGQSSYDKNAVTFGTYLGQEPKTRATVTTIEVMKGNTYPGFGVFAYNTEAANFADASSTATPDFMRNEQVKWDDTAWTYTNVKRWPDEEKVSFFAYAPYTATPGAENITDLPSQTTTGDPVIAFTVAKNVGDQIDFLYAEAKTDQTKETNGGKVQFEFNHALSRIGFKAKLEGEAGSKGSVTINTITFKSSALSTSGKFNLHTGKWIESKAEENMKYTFTTDNFETGSNVLTLPEDEAANNPVVLTGNGNYLMLIPTGPDSKAGIDITVNYTETLEDGTPRSVTLTTPFEFAFEQGKAYSLVLSINLTPKSEQPIDVSFTAEVKSWDNLELDGSGGDVDIDYNVATLTLYAMNPDLIYNYAHFRSDNSFLRIIKVPCEADEVEYEFPDDLLELEAEVTVPQAFEDKYGTTSGTYKLGDEVVFQGWADKKIPLIYSEMVTEIEDDIVVNHHSKRKIKLTKGTNTTLYPCLSAGGTN